MTGVDNLLRNLHKRNPTVEMNMADEIDDERRCAGGWMWGRCGRGLTLIGLCKCKLNFRYFMNQCEPMELVQTTPFRSKRMLTPGLFTGAER